MTPATIRARRDEDVPALARTLLEQQPTSGYPHRDPLPFPAEEFIRRPGQSAAWVAEVGGEPVGHVAISTPPDPAGLAGGDADLVRTWMDAHGRAHDELGEVVLLFTATGARGSGVGTALLATAVGALRDRGLAPCLDVVPTGVEATLLYRRTGWREVGTVRPGWLEAEAPDVVVMVLDGH